MKEREPLHIVQLPHEYGSEIYRTQVGSGVHGVTIVDQDDRDEMGMCIEPPRFVTGLDRFEQWIHRTQPEGVRSGPGDLDLVVYSLRKWMRLALQGNPTVLIPLFAPPGDIVIHSPIALGLRRNAERFVHAGVADRFLGYMQSQREQLLGLRGKKHTNRPELVETYGYDTKFAYHMIRLGMQGVELLTHRTITLPMPQPAREWLIGMRTGQVDLQVVLNSAVHLERELKGLRDTVLPDEPDREWANSWLYGTYLREWRHRYGGGW